MHHSVCLVYATRAALALLTVAYISALFYFWFLQNKLHLFGTVICNHSATVQQAYLECVWYQSICARELISNFKSVFVMVQVFEVVWREIENLLCCTQKILVDQFFLAMQLRRFSMN